ncbi:MAG: hypothetical protein AAFO72_08480 [Pseudomonadota bacterium]
MNQISDMSRDEAESLLVFLANDTLEGAERAAVEAAVEADTGLASELAALRQMRLSLQEDGPSRSPGEFGLARLMRDIDADTTVTVTHVAANRPRNPAILKIAVAVLLGLFLTQSAFIYLTGGQDGSEFQLASGDPVTSEDRPTMRVDFVQDVALSEIAALLLESDLTIVNGPSALGFYVLEATDADSFAKALEILQNKPDVVNILE